MALVVVVVVITNGTLSSWYSNFSFSSLLCPLVCSICVFGASFLVLGYREYHYLKTFLGTKPWIYLRSFLYRFCMLFLCTLSLMVHIVTVHLSFVQFARYNLKKKSILVKALTCQQWRPRKELQLWKVNCDGCLKALKGRKIVSKRSSCMRKMNQSYQYLESVLMWAKNDAELIFLSFSF